MRTIEVFFKEPLQNGDIISSTFEKCTHRITTYLEEKFIVIRQTNNKTNYIAIDHIARIVVTRNEEV